jgi:hypothetical protein
MPEHKTSIGRLSTGRFILPCRAEKEMSGLLHRVRETDRARLLFEVDGSEVRALEGDSLLVAILTSRDRLRVSEFGDGPRAGFCLMGACQDCWVWTESGTRLRACTTPATAGLKIVTDRAVWPSPA